MLYSLLVVPPLLLLLLLLLLLSVAAAAAGLVSEAGSFAKMPMKMLQNRSSGLSCWRGPIRRALQKMAINSARVYMFPSGAALRPEGTCPILCWGRSGL